MDLTLGGRGRYRWLLLIVVVALIVGAAAALLSGPAGAFTPSGGASGSPLSFTTFSLVFGWTVVGLCAVWIGFHIYQRRTEGSASIPNRFLVMFLVAVLVCIAFILVVRAGFVGHGGLFPTGPVTGGGSSNTTPPTSANNSTGLPFGNVDIGGGSLPGWLVFVGVVAAAIAGVVIAIPVIASLKDRSVPPTNVGARASARRDLADAIRALDETADPDPREVIVALYARLLNRISPSLEGLAAMAPREIESECVTQLRIRAATSRELTRLFEEARYSTHTLPSGTAERARAVFRAAVDDLDHPPGLL